jgi:hypothetical protein
MYSGTSLKGPKIASIFSFKLVRRGETSEEGRDGNTYTNVIGISFTGISHFCAIILAIYSQLLRLFFAS